jgi:DCC1-like thiol-disulfide oxidoreductase
VIYDADCGFCRWSLALLLSLDRKRVLRPLPLGTAEADRLLAELTPEERAASWHLVVEPPPDGPEQSRPGAAARSAPLAAAVPVRFSAGAAFAPALSLLRRGRIPAAGVARIPRATERGYRWVVAHRGAVGRLVPARGRRWADRVIAAHVGPGPQ